MLLNFNFIMALFVVLNEIYGGPQVSHQNKMLTSNSNHSQQIKNHSQQIRNPPQQITNRSHQIQIAHSKYKYG